MLITRFADVPYEHYMMLLDKLHEAGITASIYLGTKKFGKQIDYAVKGGYTHTVTVGGDEYQKSTLRLKNLTTREEIECDLSEAIANLK